MNQPTHNIELTQNMDKTSWEAAVAQFPEANFLQSWNWGVFQQNLGKQVFRVAAIRGGRVVGLCQAVREPARRGAYLAIAGGPLCDWTTDSAILYAILDDLRVTATQSGCVFIRLRPQQLDTTEVRQRAMEMGLRHAPMHLTADLTLQLDLTQSLDMLLSQMRKNTRAAIRKAESLGVTVRQSQVVADIHDFYLEQLRVAERHGFVPFSEKFLTEQFAAFAADGQVVLFQAWQGGVRLAEAFVIFYNGEAVYHYGVSTDANAKLPGSYACQWAAIQEAQRRGCTRYNFWGIAPVTEMHHRFAGVSLFKRGFGGQEVAYLPAHDLPLTWKYQLTYWFEVLRRKMRKLD